MEITCQKCGADNRLGTLFCRECGERLDLNAMEPGRGKKRKSINIGTLISRLIRLVILVVVCSLFGLLCWGVAAPGDVSTGNGAQQVVSKMTALRGAVLRKNEVVDTISEADINAYLNGRLANAEGGSGLLKMTLEEVNLDLQEGGVVAWMNTKLGPLPLTYTVEAAVSRESNGKFIFKTGTVCIGHVPMPGPLQGRVIDQFTAVFSQLQDENVLLNRLVHVRPIDGALELGTVAK